MPEKPAGGKFCQASAAQAQEKNADILCGMLISPLQAVSDLLALFQVRLVLQSGRKRSLGRQSP